MGALALSAVLVVALTVAALVLPVPYVLLSPGPVTDTLGAVDGRDLIRIEGRETFPTAGELNLTTVSVSGGPAREVNLAQALTGWVDPDVAVAPLEQVYPPGRTQSQVQEENDELMVASQSSATAAALRALDIPVEGIVLVGSVQPDAPARDVLEVGDVLLSVEGTPVATAQEVRDAVQDLPPDEPVTMTVRRDGAESTLEVPTRQSPDGRTIVGILPEESYAFPFTVEISIDDVGGPSAGLMFALGIVDKLTAEDLTGGSVVAGTGTIDGAGTVGPIGGIPQKLAAADDAGASLFLVPAANCAEALGAAPDGLQLVRVDTLDSALSSLASWRADGEAPSCEV